MSNRRNFIKKATLGTLAISSVLGFRGFAKNHEEETEEILEFPSKRVKKPVVISTWNHGLPANQETWKQMKAGKSALDALEAGLKIPEADPTVRSVGYGGYPDREGKVTLDACIMDHNSNCGSVCFLQGIKHPISVAKRVLQNTPHVMLAGQGALQFALSEGFPISYSPEAGFIGYNPMELKTYQADICPQSSFPLNPFGVVLYCVSKI